MADEFLHSDVGTSLTEAEYDSITAHSANNQQVGDLLKSNATATGWIRFAAGTEGYVLKVVSGEPAWAAESSGGAPTSADYLVGTANGSLTNEIVVGTTPGGELGGTWASPTVDTTHSGSAHHSENHASRHSDGGADEITIENLATSGAAGTAPVSDGAGGLSMTDVATQSELNAHAGTLASKHTANNWKVFYSNGSGTITELSLGSSGTVLTANGVSSAPTFTSISHDMTASVHTATAHRTFYSNGSGAVTALAHGSSGDVLTSNGASSAPSWQTPSSGSLVLQGSNTTQTDSAAGSGTITQTVSSLSIATSKWVKIQIAFSRSGGNTSSNTLALVVNATNCGTQNITTATNRTEFGMFEIIIPPYGLVNYPSVEGFTSPASSGGSSTHIHGQGATARPNATITSLGVSVTNAGGASVTSLDDMYVWTME